MYSEVNFEISFFVIKCTTAAISLIFSGICAGYNAKASATKAATVGIRAEAPEKISFFFASHGDIDDYKIELEDYIKTSFQKNVGIPLPDWSRSTLTNPSYILSVGLVTSQCEKIGATEYRKNSILQADGIERELKQLIPNSKVYLGYNFTAHFIYDTMAQMQKDSITTIVVANKVAQFSYASSGENMEDVLEYLNDHPEYNAKVLGVVSYSHDERFVDAMAEALKRDAKELFPNAADNKVCMLIASHGLRMWLINKGDPAVAQMRATFEKLKGKLPGVKLYHGFLNDDFFPGAKWVSPKAITIAEKIVSDCCRNVLMDGRLSFTTHHRATLFDLNVELKDFFATQSLIQKEKGLFSDEILAQLAPNFDADINFAKYMAKLVQETLELKGFSILLKDFDSPALKEGEVGLPGVVLPGVTIPQDKISKN
jgi:protoheme ferro-lyase